MKYYIIFFVTIAFLASCVSTHRFIESPTSANIIYLIEKGESQFTTSYAVGGFDGIDGRKGHNNGFDVQGAYAITNKIAIIGSYHHKDEAEKYVDIPSKIYERAHVNYKRNYLNAGLGYLIPLNSKKSTSLNLFVGYRHDNNRWKERSTSDTFEYNRFFEGSKSGFFILPSLTHTSKNDFFKTGFFFKITAFKLKSFDSDYTPEEEDFYNFKYMQNNGGGYLQFGWDARFRLTPSPWLYAGFNASILFSDNRNFPSHLYSRVPNFSIGLTVFPKGLSRLKR